MRRVVARSLDYPITQPANHRPPPSNAVQRRSREWARQGEKGDRNCGRRRTGGTAVCMGPTLPIPPGPRHTNIRGVPTSWHRESSTPWPPSESAPQRNHGAAYEAGHSSPRTHPSASDSGSSDSHVRPGHSVDSAAALSDRRPMTATGSEALPGLWLGSRTHPVTLASCRYPDSLVQQSAATARLTSAGEIVLYADSSCAILTVRTGCLRVI